MTRRLFVFQGGGPTAVINATLSGILDKSAGLYDEVLGLKHSLEMVHKDKLLNLTPLVSPHAQQERARLARTPGAVLGSSRRKVEYVNIQNLLNLMQSMGATDIIGIGGNGTMALLQKLSELAANENVPVQIVGAPKTVDNDLPGVSFAPGYGSAARFVATAVRDFDCDFRAMQTFDDVTILETMGRNSGWLAAASVLLKEDEKSAPHMVLVPERPVDVTHFLDEVIRIHQALGRVFIVSNEMLVDIHGNIIGADVQDGPKDGLGRTMYSLSTGTGNYLAQLIFKQLGMQARCLRPGNLGRALSSCVSEVDFDLAVSVGRKSVEFLEQFDGHARMVAVDRNLALSSGSLHEGVGSKLLPNKFLDSQSPYAISSAFPDKASKIIGQITPLHDAQIY